MIIIDELLVCDAGGGTVDLGKLYRQSRCLLIGQLATKLRNTILYESVNRQRAQADSVAAHFSTTNSINF